ncbi:MAG: calcium-translocating P-type ATPase, PMCA-type [Bacteroidales bacterium]|jgi:Ca2+-transporting ATPase|nr:calcium-translocating P-type ATPase, PMCA-type [Bacteroidales bacterium]
MEQNFYNFSIQETEKIFSTSCDKGLTEQQVQELRANYGFNEFDKKKKKSLFIRFLEQFKSFMIIVLIIAAVISGIVGVLHHEGIMDSIIILCVVVLNAIIGVAQEAKAESSLEALEKMSAPHCKVIRDGVQKVILSRELVPGDVVVLDTGDAIPADLRLTETINLKTQESALTGESLPEDKSVEAIEETEVPLGDRANLAFSSCIVTYGRGKGIVTATGMKTEVGKIAAMIQSVPDTLTPMQLRLNDLGKMLGIAALAICIIIFIAGLLWGKEWMEMFMIAISLAVAAIPESLPAIATIVLAIGVQRLAKQHAIVRTLSSVEVLGSTTVICSDKTGTLTQNKMTVAKMFADETFLDINQNGKLNNKFQTVLQIAILCNDTKLIEESGMVETIGDPTETALVDAGLRFSMDKNNLDKKFPRVEEIPFDSERKLMTTVHRHEDSLLVYTKGALDELLACCTKIELNGEEKKLDDAMKERIHNANYEMAENALRVLGMAYKRVETLPEKSQITTLENDLIFVGMLGMIDPPRPEVRDAVHICRNAGIKPVMITGDHKVTAVAIAKDLGILEPGGEAITGLELQKMGNNEFNERIENINVYARVSPENKVRIVKQFQHRGEVVSMTGDGVNDAPALKLADIGVAMGITGTDVSKQAADIVLADDNFATIVSSVKEGRRIYDNILKAINFLLATNIGELLTLFVAVLVGWGSPLLAVHILIINLVTDSLPALALSFDPAAPNIMKRKPNNSHESILNRSFILKVLAQGMLMGALTLIAFRIGVHTSIAVGQTMAFGVLALSQLIHVFNIRSGSLSAFKNIFSNKYLLGAIVLSALIVLGILEISALHDIFSVTDLYLEQWMIVIGFSLMPLPIMEIWKLFSKLFSMSHS